MFKRIFDLLLGLLLIIILTPIILVLALSIWLKMGSPVLIKQKRPGYKGKPFYLYKFRTMTLEVDSEGNLLDDDHRLTILGRWLRRYSLDELPQLVNIIKGEISFVGPRPLLMAYLKRYTPEQARRHDVKPGITGWAQINGRNALTWEEKFDLDIWYVDNQSLVLDFRIIWITLIKVLKAEGINQEGWATMPEFMGYGPDPKIKDEIGIDFEEKKN